MRVKRIEVSSTGALLAHPSQITKVTLNAGAGADCRAVLYDNPSAASGHVIARLAAVGTGAANERDGEDFGGHTYEANAGIYVTMTGTGYVACYVPEGEV